MNDITLAGTLNLFAIGGAGSDVLRGNAGDNTFSTVAWQGSDTLIGGRGDDVYEITGSFKNVSASVTAPNLGGMKITELAAEGTDTLVAGLWSVTLPDNVENLTLAVPDAMTGSSVDYLRGAPNDYTHRLTGNALPNEIDTVLYEAYAANQPWWQKVSTWGMASIAEFRLDGGAGADTLVGGSRNDTYVVDNAGDVVRETGNFSTDTVETPFAASLADFGRIENITLTGSAPVSATGDDGANTLSGALNAAANVLAGGNGNDTYVIGKGDVVVEPAQGGSDALVVVSFAGSTIELADFAHVESVRLSRDAGPLNAGGTDADNVMVGSLAANVLDAGAGNDTLEDQWIPDTAVGSFIDQAFDNDRLVAGPGEDTLISHGGLDTLDGGAGNDVFALNHYSSADPARQLVVAWGLGDGQDTLTLNAADLVTKDATRPRIEVQLKAPVGPADVSAFTEPGIFALALGDGSVLRFPAGCSISLRFADGLVLAPDVVAILANGGDRTTATDGADLLFGTAAAEAIASLGGNDAVYAGAGADTLDGGAGDDKLVGGGGSDVLAGGTGNDLLAGGTGADVYRYTPGGGQDLIDDTRDSGPDDGAVDTLELDASIAVADVTVVRTITGSTPTGLALLMRGGADIVVLNNAYAAGNAGAVEIVRFAGSGTQWDLAAQKSKVAGDMGSDSADQLTASVSAGSRLFGMAGNDSLTGAGGNDTLDGGTGADAMWGALGNDTFYVDHVGDAVYENTKGGTDTVITTLTGYVLAAEVERLEFAGTADLQASGNALANTITGNAGHNRLNGGAGADTLAGGAGNDTYVVDVSADLVTEQAGGGIDIIETALGLTLPANVEGLKLTGSTTKLTVTGNALANWIDGSAVANTLNGGDGADVLRGDAGDDVLTDTLGNGAYEGGPGADSLTGGNGNQLFAGGAGNDVLKLGAGSDVIAFARGDAADTVLAPVSGAGAGESNDTLSLGHVRLSELRLTREGGDLLVHVAGTADAVRFKDWYLAAGNQSVERLQMVADSSGDYTAGSDDALYGSRVGVFQFKQIVAGYDGARAANPSLVGWAPGEAVMRAALVEAGSTAAYGGVLAYRVAHDGGLGALGFGDAMSQLEAGSFGAAQQGILTPLALVGVAQESAG